MVVSKCLSLTLHVPTHPSTPFLTPPSKKTPTLSYSFTHFSFQTKLNKAFPTSYNHSLTKHFPMKCSNSSSYTSPPDFELESDDPTLTNEDLKPTTPSQRTFSGFEIASLWVGLVVGVPSYYLAGSLVDLGMAWWQGIATVVAANMILLVPLVLTGHAGTRYGISFPVLVRSSFGINGAHVPTLIRALIGCGWYGIESWIGGEAIFLLLPKAMKEATSLSQSLPWLGTSPLEFACFLVFWVAQLAFVWKGIDGIRKLEKYSAPILVALTSCLLIWSCVKAGGIGHMLSLSSRLSTSEFWSVFFLLLLPI